MAKRADIQKQIDALSKELESAEDDDELELLVEKDGARTQLRGTHAKRWLRKLGLDDEDQADELDATDGDGDGGDGAGDAAKGDAGTDPKPKSPSRFFR